MPRTIYLDKLLRLTLTRKGRAIAKHPYLREGAVEAVKAEPIDEPLWHAVKATEGWDEELDDWYAAFDRYRASVPFEDIPEDWLEGFQRALGDELTEKARARGKKQQKNYPDSEGPFAGPHNSFPIRSQEDVIHAAERLHNAGGSQSSIRARIIAIAHAHGYHLPKSWQKKVTKSSMDEEQFKALVAALSDAIKGNVIPAAEAEAEPEAPAELPEAVEAAEEPEEPEEAEKAKAMTHSHEHNHSTQRGYGYSHTHDHSHQGDMSDHETSESAHGHDHVSKADEMDPAVKADLEGLDAKVAELAAQVATLETEKAALLASLQAKEAEAAEKTTEAEAAKAELTKAEDAAREPLTGAIPTTEKAEEKPITEMSFDDALSTLLHR